MNRSDRGRSKYAIHDDVYVNDIFTGKRLAWISGGKWDRAFRTWMYKVSFYPNDGDPGNKVVTINYTEDKLRKVHVPATKSPFIITG